MVATLEAEAEDDATQKAYCDKQMSETTAKRDELAAHSDKLSTKIAQDKASSAKLKEESATLQNELASMASAKAEAASPQPRTLLGWAHNPVPGPKPCDRVSVAMHHHLQNS